MKILQNWVRKNQLQLRHFHVMMSHCALSLEKGSSLNEQKPLTTSGKNLSKEIPCKSQIFLYENKEYMAIHARLNGSFMVTSFYSKKKSITNFSPLLQKKLFRIHLIQG